MPHPLPNFSANSIANGLNSSLRLVILRLWGPIEIPKPYIWWYGTNDAFQLCQPPFIVYSNMFAKKKKKN